MLTKNGLFNHQFKVYRRRAASNVHHIKAKAQCGGIYRNCIDARYKVYFLCAYHKPVAANDADVGYAGFIAVYLQPGCLPWPYRVRAYGRCQRRQSISS